MTLNCYKFKFSRNFALYFAFLGDLYTIYQVYRPLTCALRSNSCYCESLYTTHLPHREAFFHSIGAHIDDRCFAAACLPAGLGKQTSAMNSLSGF